MIRRETWQADLADFIEQRRGMPFAWGVQDCCQFAREAIRVQTGVDVASSWNLAPYASARGAAAVLRPLGGVSALPALAGLTETRLTMARRGDIVAVPVRRRLALGVCMGELTAAPGKRGLEFHPTLSCSRAWRI